jgi:hypothetical protein
MLLATILKLWDAIAHFVLPTPAARHTKPPKEEPKENVEGKFGGFTFAIYYDHWIPLG